MKREAWKDLHIPICDNDVPAIASAAGLSIQELVGLVRRLASALPSRHPKAPQSHEEAVLLVALQRVNPEWSERGCVEEIRAELGKSARIYPARVQVWRQYKQESISIDVLGELEEDHAAV